jgi:hypothetical protein
MLKIQEKWYCFSQNVLDKVCCEGIMEKLFAISKLIVAFSIINEKKGKGVVLERRSNLLCKRLPMIYHGCHR